MTDTIKAADDTRQLIVRPDVIDLRDRYYSPSLVPLKQRSVPEAGELRVRDQRDESACTGFALAAVIDLQCRRSGLPDDVSTRMLFEMAKLHDDLPDQTTPGSTLRGAIKGFFHNGVCDEQHAPYVAPPGTPPWQLDVESAKRARKISLGAYFRLNHEVNDYHAAINEAGAVIASAKIHSGWANPRGGVIGLKSRMEGRHAFAIVGYTEEGFLVQNSWSDRWGGFRETKADGSKGDPLNGVALWSYQDWFENVEDAWVLRLAVSAPNAFDVKFARNHAMFRDPKAASKAFVPRRQDINGHFLHLDDGEFVTSGRYAQTAASIDTTVKLLRQGTSDLANGRRYQHLLIVAHGALSGKSAIARRIQAWAPVFKANGIYPMHIMWETGFNNDVVDVIQDLLFRTRERMGSSAEHLDERLEEMARPLGRKLWRDLQMTTGLIFHPQRDGGTAIRRLIEAARTEPRIQVHFASISAGAFLLAELADVMKTMHVPLQTANLMAPACSLAHYYKRIRPHLGETISSIRQYSLIKRREENDNLNVYSKSLLYLVSNALESADQKALLGMQAGWESQTPSQKSAWPAAHQIYHAGRDRLHCDARGHRDFDRDQKTMNDILGSILGAKPRPSRDFSKGNLSGY